MLGDGGFVLMNDLCARPLDQPFASFCYQLYGGSTAIPVNFPLLECWARRQHGAAWFQPFEDTAPLRHRLLTREPAPETIERFRRDFSKTAREQLKDRAVRAARLREEGHPDEALELYRQALLEQPYNWFLRKEAAALLLDDKQDCAGALLMVKSALDLNPLDVGAWIIAGVSLHRLGRLDGARKAFLRALKSNPRHVEARYHLSLTLAGQGNYERALRVIAEALSEDRTGEDRDRLLARQSEILEAFQAHSQ
jgi:tetratricopeptide (TPR) repeat protein